MNNTKKFVYSEKDFVLADRLCTLETPDKLSKFDKLICSSWDHGMENGYFRYRIDDLRSRVVPGTHGYVAQLNLRRGVERRKPEHIDSLSQPFDESLFNFTKVPNREIICEMCPQRQRVCGNSTEEDRQQTQSSGRHVILINVSPLEYGHLLLVPDVDSCIPQRLTLTSIRLSVEMLLLSSHPGLRVGFNSLCALASVNHQHVHAWYLQHSIRTEYAPVREVCKGCYELVDMPTRGFAFQLHGNTIDQISQIVYTVADYFQQNDIAHNMFLTRGPIFGEDRTADYKTVRIYLWPRKSVIGVKNETKVSFNVAVAELAGHIPVYVAEGFDDMTEKDINTVIARYIYTEDEFSNLKQHITTLLRKT